MWKQIAVACSLGVSASIAQASPWYAEAGYAGSWDEGNLALGYQFRPWFGLEAGYRRSDEGDRIGELRQLDESDGFDVLMRTTIDVSPRFALTGRFGLYAWEGEEAYLPHGGEPAIAERSGVSPILGAGLRVGLTPHLALTGELTASEGYAIGGGLEHMVTAGLRASF